MSDAPPAPSAPAGVTAGRLLREAREAQGLPIAALASAIKVAPRKLEALEADRLGELADATFARALAQTVCRTLKIDAAPVLALLPRTGGQDLGHLGEGLNTPFREGSGQPSDGEWSVLARPAVWAPIVVLLIAAAVYLAPASWLEFGRDRSQAQASASSTAPPGSTEPRDRAAGPSQTASSSTTATPAMAAASARPTDGLGTAVPGATASEQIGTGVASSGAVDGASSQPGVKGTPAASIAPAMAAADEAPASSVGGEAPPKPLFVRAVRDSWIEVLDASGQALLSRTLKTGETVELEGALPLRVRIGNAAYTEIRFRGEALPLAPYTRNNLARLELK